MKPSFGCKVFQADCKRGVQAFFMGMLLPSCDRPMAVGTPPPSMLSSARECGSVDGGDYTLDDPFRDPVISLPESHMRPEDRPLVSVIMGSKSDWETLRHADEMLTRFGVPHECH